MSKKSLRQLFDEAKKAAYKKAEIRRELDERIIAKWGFHFSDVDEDTIIDCLDYAHVDMTFEDFVERMDYEKSQREDDDD